MTNEINNIREQVEEDYREIEFRFIQFQVELKANRTDKAQECEDRISELTDRIFANLRKRASIDIQLDDGMDLQDILKRALN